jgi:hypothetical protein
MTVADIMQTLDPPTFLKKLLAPAMLGLFLHAGAMAAPATAPVQSQASYEAAIADMSTSPAYVLVEAGDSGNAAPRPVCTSANFLLGAIHREHGLGYAPTESEQALRIAREHADHVFRVHYAAADLAAARAAGTAVGRRGQGEVFMAICKGPPAGAG